jgi:hypothetical protein
MVSSGILNNQPASTSIAIAFLPWASHAADLVQIEEYHVVEQMALTGFWAATCPKVIRKGFQLVEPA